MAGARVLLLSALLLLAPAAGRRLICWQAVLQCQGEQDCTYAYSLYTEACAPVLQSAPPGPRRCPSHCISAIIQLNQTRRGPALEDCDCAQDESCRQTKRAIEPCLPRTGHGSAAAPGAGTVMGCTEARLRCERDHRCSAALRAYLTHCGKLFNGLRCAHECRAVIQDMLAMPKALPLSNCICDGLERPFCEAVKENMDRLCFSQEPGHQQPGAGGSSGGSALDLGDYYYDNEYDDETPRGEPELRVEAVPEVRIAPSSGAPPAAARLPALLLAAWTSVASILRPLL